MVDSEAIADARRLAESLEDLPEPTVRPAFVVVSGLPGTGKSYFCRKLADRLPLAILESDALRKVLSPSPTYAPEESTRLFKAIHELIYQLLKKGISLVLDATNLSEAFRERLYSIAERVGVKLVIVRVHAPPLLVQERLKARMSGPNVAEHSEADWEVYQKLKPTVEAIRRRHYAVDTSRDITPVLDKIIREIRRAS